MVELEYNGERYMVDGGKWYRRLKVGDRITDDSEVSTITMPLWRETQLAPTKVLNNPSINYRVPCTDPRPPFVVGQRVKVARKDESWKYWESYMETYIGVESPVISIDSDGCVEVDVEHEGTVYLPPWCLDPVEPTFGEKIIDRMEKFTEELEASDIDPELDHILKKLKSHADRAADVRRIKRECYQKLAELLPEKK